MVNPLEVINAQRRRGVQVYAPGRGVPVPARQQRVPMPRRVLPTNGEAARAAGVRGPGVDWAGLAEKVTSTPAAQQAKQKQAEKQAKDQAYEDAPWYGKGLGMVLGNPVSKAILTPLNYLQTLGRGVTLGVEELAENAPEWAQGLSEVVDTERTEADKRSNWEKLFAPDTDYGFGQLLDKDNPAWVNDVAGFVGDVALDPLTYASFGATKVIGGAAKSAKLAEAARAAELAEKFTDDAARLASRAGHFGDLEEAANLGRKAAEQQSMARKLGLDAEEIPLRQAPVRQGRKAREQMVSELAEIRPELLKTHADELARATQRGFNTLDDPMLREALGLQRPGARILGAEIPFSERAVRRGAKIGGGVRAGLNKVPLLEPTLAKFTPKGLEEASGTLSRGKGGDVLRAATTVRIQNLMRQGTGRMEGEGNKALTDLVRQMRGMGGEEELRRLFREAETSADQNIVNKFFGEDIPKMYERIAGRPMDVTRDKNTYVPHMHTPSGRRFLATLDNQTVTDMGFQADDLLEGSKFLEKSRKLTPDKIGEPTTFKIGDRGSITLTDGTIEELNDELGKLFPEFKGKFYDDDPARIGEAYVSSVARQAGRDRALDALADSENPLVRDVTGELLSSVETRNKFLRQNPVAEMVRKGHTAGQRLLPAKAKGEMPTTAFDDMFATTLAEKETQANRDLFSKEGKQFVKDVGADVTKTRSTLADNIKGLRTTLMEGLKKKSAVAESRIKTINVALDRMDDEIKKVGKLTSENVDDLVGMSTTVDASILDAKAQVKKIRDRYGKKIPRDQAAIEKELQKTLRRLEAQAEQIRTHYSRGTAEMRAEAAARKAELEQPIKDATKELDQAKAAVGQAPVAKDRVQAANAYIRSNFATEDAFEAQRQQYFEALNVLRDSGTPIMRRVDGRLTPETAEAVLDVVAEMRKVEPPAAAAVTPPVPTAAPEVPLVSAGGEAAPPAAAPPPAPPPVAAKPAPTAAAVAERRPVSLEKRYKLSDGSNTYVVRDGVDEYTIRKNNDGQWIVRTNDQSTAGTRGYRSLGQAQEAINRGDHAAVAPTPPVAVPTAVPEAPPAPAPPPKPSTKMVKEAPGFYASEDGYSITKTAHGWQILHDDVDDFGLYDTLPEAKAEVAAQQRMTEMNEAAAEVATPVAAEEVAVPPVADAPVSQPEALAPPEPTTKRITRRWAKKELQGRQIEVLEGPDAGWWIEPYEQGLSRAENITLRGEDEAAAEAVRSGKRPTRYIATHQTDEGMVSRSFASAREAKIAVEDMLRRRRRTETLAEYAERAQRMMRGETVQGSSISNVREIPPSTLTPEEAAANVAASAGAGRLQRPEPYAGPPVYEPTEAGAEVEKLRPPTQARNYDKYWQDYEAWKAQEARSLDESLTKTERAKAKRQARSMGGAFTQTTGEHYNRHAAEKIVIDDADWTAKVEANENVAAAQAKLDLAVKRADEQVEAMVYTKHHNPITGEDEYTRLPAGSTVGFGEGVERTPVQIQPPERGYTPTGTREPAARRQWESRRTQMDRDADNMALADLDTQALMMPEARSEYERLTDRATGINERLDAAASNETELNRLDEAAKAAYTSDVKAADDAVKEARAAEARARPGEDATPGAQERWTAAKRATQEAVDHQTEVRQAWMQADRAWKAKLAERDEYLAAQRKVTSAEQTIYHLAKGEGGSDIVDAIRNDQIPKLGNNPLAGEVKDAALRFQKALIELDDMDAAGRTFMGDVERRRLAGNLTDINYKQRELIERVAPYRVSQAEDVLPHAPPEPGRFDDRIFGQTPPPTTVPPTQFSGQPDLTARAYAESFEPTEPGPPRDMFKIVGGKKATAAGGEAVPEGVEGAVRTGKSAAKYEPEMLQAVPMTTGRQLYKPGTEREAIGKLEAHAANIEQSPAAQAARRNEANIGRQMEAERGVAEARKAETGLLQRAERDEALLPIKDRIETLGVVNDALHEKQKLIPLRDQAIADRATVVKAKNGKKADLVKIADEIEAVAKQNPELLDDDLAVTEALLHDTRKEAERIAEADMSSKQVQGVIDRMVRGKTSDIDVMLTTVGKNWKMLYESNNGRGNILKKGDTLVEAELHKMFTNLYEIKKDPVLFGRTFNAFTNLFKTYATLTPGFHVRNALSAIFMNATDGVPMRTQFNAAGLWREYMNAPDGTAWLTEQPQKIQDAFAVAHASGAGGRFTEAGFARNETMGANWLNWMNSVQNNKVTRFSQRVGSRVEGSVRLAMGMHSMDLGESIEAATQRVNRIHFDYGEISQLDDMMKRVVPFWTFMSRNMPMQVSQMWTHPQVYTTYERFVNNASADNEEYTPEYWTKAGAWNTGIKMPGFIPESFGGGLPIYMQPDLGYTRLESDLKDYENFLSGKKPGAVLSQANPLLSAPVEYATRQDIFTGQKFEEGETVPVGGLNALYKIPAGIFGQTADGEVDAAFMNAIRALNPLTDRTTRLAPQLTGNDPEGVKRQIESWLRTGLGAPVRTLTPKQQDNEYFRRYYDQLDAAERQQERESRKAG